MFGLSTSWKSKNCNNGAELLNLMEEAEVPGIELEYRITVDMFNQMKNALKKSPLSVLSIHNYFPHPEILPADKASGDAFYLSSLDPQERKLAVKYSMRSIQYAHDMEVGAVVFHLGKVDIEKEQQKWFELYDKGEVKTAKGKQFIENKLKLRQEKRDKNLDAVMFSLDRLNNEAIKRNVKLGIENRYNWNEIPDMEEVGILLQRFDGGNVRYWHDCGHAQTSQNLGLTHHEEFLKMYGEKLLGIHLHDCNGYNDHIAPGKGEIDFEMVKTYLPDNSIKIFEVHHVSLSELREGIDYLKNMALLS